MLATATTELPIGSVVTAMAVSLLSDSGNYANEGVAKAILENAVVDAKRQARGIPLSKQLPGDRERVVEVIGEAQWFLLDDDEECVFSFSWCCQSLGLNTENFRDGVRRKLVALGVVLPRRERHRLANLAGPRRDGRFRTRNQDHRAYHVSGE